MPIMNEKALLLCAHLRKLDGQPLESQVPCCFVLSSRCSVLFSAAVSKASYAAMQSCCCLLHC